MSELVPTSQQVATLEVTNKSAAFLVTLQNMNRRFGVLYQSIIPVLRRHLTDHTGEQCEEIKVWITTVTQRLELSTELGDVGHLMRPFLQPDQVARMEELLAVMDIWQVEMEKAIAWLKDALETSTLILAGRLLEDS